MELDPDLPAARELQQRGRPVAAEGDFRVGRVMAEDDAVDAAELDRLLEELVGRGGGGRIVGVVQPEQLGALADVGRNGGEVRQPGVPGRQRQHVGLAVGHDGARRVGRVPRVGGEHHLPRVDEGEGRVADAVLGAQRRQDLPLRVELHSEAVAVPVGDRRPQCGQPEVGRIAVVGGIRRRLLERADDSRRGRQVGVADAEADHVHARGLLGLHLPVDLGEEVGRDARQAARGVHGGVAQTFVSR